MDSNILIPRLQSIIRGYRRLRRKVPIEIAMVTLLIGVLLVSTSISSLMSSITVPSSGTIGTINMLPLHVEGNLIKDSLNNTIVLRGVNKVEFADDPDGIWMGNVMWTDANAKAELAAMKSWGINVVRCHLNIEDWIVNTVNVASDTGHASIPAQTALTRFAQFAAQDGIYVIYDGYSVRDYYNGETQDPLPYPPYQTTSGASSVIASQQDFINWWVSMANVFKSYPNVIFELWNEPHGNSAAKTSWFTVAQSCTTAIRATGATNLIVFQWDYGNYWDLDHNSGETFGWITQANLNDSSGNLVYSTHIYDAHTLRSGGIGGRYAYTLTDMNQSFQNMGYYSAAQSYPIIIGETGCDISWSGTDLTNEYTRFTNELSLFNQTGIGFLGFWWRQIGQYALYNGPPSFTPNQAGQILRTYLLQ
jgi:hypothetical protein